MTRQFSAGGVVYKKDLWLIIRHRPNADFPKEQWRLPKGQIEHGEEITATALREVWEETGIKAKIITKVDYQKYVFNFRDEKIFKVVTYFLMEYVSGEPVENIEVEKILWLPLGQALKTLSFSADKATLKKAAKLVKSS